MNQRSILILIFSVLWVSASADSPLFFDFELYPAEKNPSYYYKQIDSYLKIFPSLDEKKDGLYVFFESEKVRKLFYLDSLQKKMVLYQYPLQNKLRWLDSKAYLNERKMIEQKGGWENVCRQSISNSKEAQEMIERMHLDRMPYMRVRYEKKIKGEDLIRTSVIWGFSRKEANIRYFYFRDVRPYSSELPLQLKMYGDLFELFESGVFGSILEDCK